MVMKLFADDSSSPIERTDWWYRQRHWRWEWGWCRGKWGWFIHGGIGGGDVNIKEVFEMSD